MKLFIPAMFSLPLLVLLALLLVRPVAAMGRRAPTVPLVPVTLQHGPFEIVAQGRQISSGTFPNQGADDVMEVTGFSVYHNGQPVTVHNGPLDLARFWRVAILTDAPRPALLVSTQGFHLITEENGAPVVQSVDAPSTGAEYLWLDGNDGQPSEPAGFYMQKVRMSDLPLRGGRYLLLQSRTVLDVQTLELHGANARIPQGQPLEGEGSGSSRQVFAFSPGHTQFVGWGRSYSSGEEGLVVVDFKESRAYGLPLQPGQRRYYSSLSLTPRWFAHYTQWTKDHQGRERLVLTHPARPLPWYGRILRSPLSTVDRDGALTTRTIKRYALARAAPTLAPVLENFVVRRFGAALVPPETSTDGKTLLQVPGCARVLRVGRLGLDESMPDLVLQADQEHEDFAVCGDLMERIASAFNAELETGVHDKHFVE